MKNYPCPCCKYLTRIEEEYGTYDICPVCWWEDDEIQQASPDLEGGANEVSLNTAIKNFKEFGASDKDFIDKVRKPLPDEIPQ